MSKRTGILARRLAVASLLAAVGLGGCLLPPPFPHHRHHDHGDRYERHQGHDHRGHDRDDRRGHGRRSR